MPDLYRPLHAVTPKASEMRSQVKRRMIIANGMWFADTMTDVNAEAEYEARHGTVLDAIRVISRVFHD